MQFTFVVIENLEAVLSAANLNLEHVVKTEVFLKDLGDFQAMNRTYALRFSGAAPPARVTIQAAKLPQTPALKSRASHTGINLQVYLYFFLYVFSKNLYTLPKK